MMALAILFASCKGKPKSSTTGWNLNDPKWGGFQKYNYRGQETGPGLLLIPGGTFTMGSQEQDVMYDNNNMERRVTVPTFYIDETEISNINYLEYLYWLGRTYVDFPQPASSCLSGLSCGGCELGAGKPLLRLAYRPR